MGTPQKLTTIYFKQIFHQKLQYFLCGGICGGAQRGGGEEAGGAQAPHEGYNGHQKLSGQEGYSQVRQWLMAVLFSVYL
jgi:hypothetical protein